MNHSTGTPSGARRAGSLGSLVLAGLTVSGLAPPALGAEEPAATPAPTAAPKAAQKASTDLFKQTCTTGTRIRTKDSLCKQATRTFTQEDLQRTGEIDTARALRELDPRFW